MNYIKDHHWTITLISIAAIFLGTYAFASLAKAIWKRKSKKTKHLLYHKFIHNIMLVIIYLIGLLLAVGQIPQLSQIAQTLLAGSGIVALALSLSAQESLGNVISGFFITLFSPFEIGDRVTLVNNSITGVIEDITLRHTIIKTFVNTRIVVPNSIMNKEIIENSHLIDRNASAFMDVTVAYESDLNKAIAIMADVIGSHPNYYDVRTEEQKKTAPKVKVFVRSFEDSGIALRANVWTQTVDTNFEACSDIRKNLKKAFDEAGIEIPYTKYTILQQEPKPCPPPLPDKPSPKKKSRNG